jgi:hypothetical protein
MIVVIVVLVVAAAGPGCETQRSSGCFGGDKNILTPGGI